MIEERYVLTYEQLIDFLKGKKLVFMLPDYFKIEIIPPNCGINIPHKEWEYIKSLLFSSLHSPKQLKDFIKQIEGN